MHRAFELRPATVLELLERSDAFRRPERFDEALIACEADSRGRTGFEMRAYPQRDYLARAHRAAAAIRPAPADLAAYRGPQIAEVLRTRRCAAIAALRGEIAAN